MIPREQVESLRGPRVSVDRLKPFAVITEREPTSKPGSIAATTSNITSISWVDVLTIFLVGAECSFRCTMCDLWKYTIAQSTQAGDLPIQLREALKSMSNERWTKLYNASNFFSPISIPTQDLEEIARLCDSFERVIVENHPKIWNRSIERFRGLIKGKLEIAMGLETVCPASMTLLNKEFSLEDFRAANLRLQDLQIDRRAFVMLQPPGTLPVDAVDWVLRTLDYAQQLGMRHASIIPTRGGNGMMEKFQAEGLFVPPDLAQLELCLERALKESWPMLITADLWNASELRSSCSACLEGRIRRLGIMNLTQQIVEQEHYPCGCNPSLS